LNRVHFRFSHDILLYAAVIALFVASPRVIAQTDSTRLADTTTLRQDTVLYTPGKRLTDIAGVNVPVNFELQRTQNPNVGLLKSMVVPGWGQIGNKRYVKAVIFAGLEGWFVSSAIRYGKQASDYRAKYTAETDVSARNAWYDLYSNRRDERNKFTWFAVLFTFVGMFDAYVDAHLSGYPSEDKQHGADFGIMNPEDGTTGLIFSVSF
jgi:Family of unknown function (DUF5683)